MNEFNTTMGEPGAHVTPDESGEGIRDLPKHIPLIVGKWSRDPNNALKLKPIKAQTLEKLFIEMKPDVEVSLEKEDGIKEKQTIVFKKLIDFDKDKITENNLLLKDLQEKSKTYEKMSKPLSKAAAKKILETPETKEAFINALKAIIQELDNANKVNP